MDQPTDIPVVETAEDTARGTSSPATISTRTAGVGGGAQKGDAPRHALRRDVRDLLCFCAFLVTAGTILYVTGIGCPIRFLTGIPCPGCGMTRAWLAVLHLDVAGAFSWHPLFWALPLIGVLHLARHRLGPRRLDICIGVLIALFLVVWVMRLILPGDAISIDAPRWLELVR